MKIRLVIVEADDVNAEDVRELLERTVSPTRAQVAAPVQHLPPSVPTAMVKPAAGWRAGPGGKKKDTAAPDSSRPVTSMKIQCAGCGADMPPGKDRRSSCPKCGGHSWEKIPAHTSKVAPDEED